MATMITMKDTEKIWQPEPIREEKIRGWLEGLNTSPWTCFQPYSSPRSRSCIHKVWGREGGRVWIMDMLQIQYMWYKYSISHLIICIQKKTKKTKHKYKNKNLEASSTGLNVKCLLKARAQNHMLILQYNPLNSYKMDRSGPRLWLAEPHLKSL